MNGLIASLLKMFFTPKGLPALILGLVLGYVVAVAPFILIALMVIAVAVLIALRKQIDFNKIKALAKGSPSPQNPIIPPPPPPAPEDKKDEKKEEKKKRITIELD